MPPSFRQSLNTSGPASSENLVADDVIMADATNRSIAAATSSPAVLTASSSLNRTTVLKKRRHAEMSDSLPQSSAKTSLNPSLRSSSRLRTIVLSPIDTTPSTAGPSGQVSSDVASPAPTEVEPEIGDIEFFEPTPEDIIVTIKAEGIKVRDFAYEPYPNAHKAPEIFDPILPLIATDWHMRNPKKNNGGLSGKSLFRLIKLGWLSMSDAMKHLHPREAAALMRYSSLPDEERYPFVVAPGDTLPPPSARVRMRHASAFDSHADDVPDSEFFGYNPTGMSDEERDDEPGPNTTGGEPNAKRQKVKARAKAKPLRREPKPLRRERSRPEV
ncbi:hypothetical protein BC834DRAFT_886799 [Gloeopeniophorella convolvens]|nr:hypothetical protein BC834DRAFT_900846 [Gloeopeniophorella convolvens]KAI0263659.1 hypothetical protein BC834DRAFT_886799 [Gloeopeniophorella convolvens]